MASRKRLRRGSGLPGLVALALLAAGSAAWGQGFMVRPMRVEVAPQAGETVQQTIEVRNTTPVAQIISVQGRLLGQSAGGSWQAQAPPEEGEGPRSCLSWMNLSASRLELAPMQGGEVEVTLNVPRGARGFYGAALTIQSEAPDLAPGQVGLLVQFIIPVQVHIQGAPARERISLDEVEMRFVPASEQQSPGGQVRRIPATTVVSSRISNQGETYARLSGTVVISRQNGGRWQSVARSEIPARGIIPGALLSLDTNLARRLPSGPYRLEAQLVVGGRRAATLTREIEFEGDPEVTSIAADVPLEFPPLVQIEATPGSARSGAMDIASQAGETVEVYTLLDVPAGLRGVAIGELTGDHLDASQWLEVYPEQFPLRGNSRRNLRLMARMPATEAPQANYYALLLLGAFYADGQSAGQSEALICVNNPQVPSRAAAVPQELRLAQAENSEYTVSARFANVGNVHWTPTAQASLVTALGTSVASAQLETEAGTVLPMGRPQFAGTLDFGRVEPGAYLLRVTMEFAGLSARRELPVRVEVAEDGTRLVTVLTPEEAAEEEELAAPEPEAPAAEDTEENPDEA